MYGHASTSFRQCDGCCPFKNIGFQRKNCTELSIAYSGLQLRTVKWFAIGIAIRKNNQEAKNQNNAG